MKKLALFAFSPDPGCFSHVMLNALEMRDRGWEVKIVLEGEATKHVAVMRNETKPYHALYRRTLNEGLFDCVCKACATKFGVLQAAIEQDIKACDEMEGHPAVGRYLADGWEVLVF
ncbi:MAG TPA: cytoplasmic protein [candidate division WOR-3 bacterium]|uniref:Cytoplasmic protein n=1 Tax=candidate division WOR-3 bacterium TaxID=2052148 RepID=A0A7V0T7E4_UNCW3|nr:cytoplasmic protein [candidate division WOR-3 bacterium]